MPVPRVNKNYQGKVSYFDYDAMLDLPDDTCLVCLSARDVALILASLEPLGWKTRYFSAIDTPISQDTIDGWQVSIQERLMADICEEINAKLDHIVGKVDHISDTVDAINTTVDIMGGEVTEIAAQQLLDSAAIAEIAAQQAIDSAAIAGLVVAAAAAEGHLLHIIGVTDETGEDVDNIEDIVADADTGVAEIAADVDSLQLLVAKMKNSVTNITNNTLITLNLGVPNQTFSSDSADLTPQETYARYNALCEAVVNWMIADAYAVIDILGATPTDLNTLAASIQAYALSLAYVLVPGVPAYTISTIVAAFTDTAAVNDVACAIITYLKDKEPNSLNFSASLAAYTPPALPDNRHIIYDTLLLALFDLQAYQGFASILQPAYAKALADNPTGYVCAPCGALSFCSIPSTFDFSLGQKAPWLIQRGILQPGVGIVGAAIPGDGSNYGYDVSWYPDATCAASLPNKGLKFTASHLPSGALGNCWTLEFWSKNNTTGAIVKYNSASFGPTVTYPTLTQSARANIVAPAAGTTLYRIRWYTNTPYYGNATAQNVTASVLSAIDLVA